MVLMMKMEVMRACMLHWLCCDLNDDGKNAQNGKETLRRHGDYLPILNLIRENCQGFSTEYA